MFYGTWCRLIFWDTWKKIRLLLPLDWVFHKCHLDSVDDGVVSCSASFFFQSSPKTIFPLILGKGREGEREKERDILFACLPHAPGIELATQIQALDWKLNPWLYSVQANALPTEHTGQGCFASLMALCLMVIIITKRRVL